MKEITASIITIGEEILYGHILDTNSFSISNMLTDIGVKVMFKSSVGDKKSEIIDALKYAELKSDIIIITGGLGPTNDDITKKCLSVYFNSPLKLNQQALQEVRDYFQRRGMALTKLNRKQAEIPESAEILTNEMGTAPGMWFERSNHIFISMPGVPHEMEHMFKIKVISRIKDTFQTPVILHKLIMTAGIGESWLSDEIADWEKDLPNNISLAYLPGYGQVKLRLTGVGASRDLLQKQISEQVQTLKKLIPNYIYGEDGMSLEKKLGVLLSDRNETLSVAESCTGGYISHMITTVPGSSMYFIGGTIAYHNDMKIEMLDVSEDTLIKCGAVSEETVKEMAEGCRQKFKTDYAVSTSGIAGPEGGSPEKPVGTIWIAVSDKFEIVAKKYNIPKDRINNIKYASIAALTLLWQTISQKNGTDR